MDLSICIPVYNQSVHSLVNQLEASANKANIQIELIIIDDCSTDIQAKKLNQELRKNSLVRYLELETNIGRAAIRNKLGSLASADFILFLDDDSLLRDSESFLMNYWNARNSAPVICGGRIYPKVVDNSYMLHWKYGTTYESKAAVIRSHLPYNSFHSNNFMISSKLFKLIRFNEKLSTYGHEDTYFAFQLEQKSVLILHLNNEVIHSDLEDNTSFLDKTDKAIENLIRLIRSEENSDFENFIKLSRTYKNTSGIVKIGLRIAAKILLKGLRKRIMDSSASENIQLYKILKYSQLHN